jgi:hypothetical protein
MGDVPQKLKGGIVQAPFEGRPRRGVRRIPSILPGRAGRGDTREKLFVFRQVAIKLATPVLKNPPRMLDRVNLPKETVLRIQLPDETGVLPQAKHNRMISPAPNGDLPLDRR